MAVIAYIDMASAAADRLVAAHATDEDHAIAARYRTPSGQRQRLGVRALLRGVLAEHEAKTTGWHILSDAHGAPRLAAEGLAQPPYLSLSHSGAMVACAVTRNAPVGIDIERIRADRPIAAIARSAFGPTESAAVEREGAETFYRLWTLREALAKASGAGFGLLTDRLDLVPTALESGLARHTINQITWDFSYWRLPEPYGLGLVLRSTGADAVSLSPICLSGP